MDAVSFMYQRCVVYCVVQIKRLLGGRGLLNSIRTRLNNYYGLYEAIYAVTVLLTFHSNHLS